MKMITSSVYSVKMLITEKLPGCNTLAYLDGTITVVRMLNVKKNRTNKKQRAAEFLLCLLENKKFS